MRVQELDWGTVPDQAVCIYIGRRKSGKTTNIIDTFFKKRNSFKMGLVFCGSKATIKEYEQHFPSSFIYYGYHSDVVGAVINKQERDVEMGCAKPIFILVDDCMWAKKSILGDPNIRRLFMNGRHSLIFFVLSMQYCMDLHPSLRQQIDFTFLSREKNPQNRERLYKNYNVCFKSHEQFESTMRQCTQNHETFVLNNGDTESDQPEDNVYWWKAKWKKEGRRFRVNKWGTWWKYHRKRFNPGHFMTDENEYKQVTGKAGKKGDHRAAMVVTKIKKNRRKCVHTQQKQPTPHHISRPPDSTHTNNAAEWLRNQRKQNLGPRRGPFSQSRVIDNGIKYIT